MTETTTVLTCHLCGHQGEAVKREEWSIFFPVKKDDPTYGCSCTDTKACLERRREKEREGVREMSNPTLAELKEAMDKAWREYMEAERQWRNGRRADENKQALDQEKGKEKQ